MTVNTNTIYNAFIKAARTALPTKLSLIGQNRDIPAVVRERGSAVKPDYPYVTVDITGISDVGSYEIGEGIDEDDNYFTANHKRALLTFTVHDKDDISNSHYADALGIANKLNSHLSRNPVIYHQMITDSGGKIEEVFDTTILPRKLQTEYVDIAAFSLAYVTTDTIVDTAMESIDSITLQGRTVEEKAPDGDETTEVDYTTTTTLSTN